MKNLLIVMTILIVLVGGVLLWDSLRNDTINKTITNNIAEDLKEGMEGVKEEVINPGTDDSSDELNTSEKSYQSDILSFSAKYPNDWFVHEYFESRKEVYFVNKDEHEGYMDTGEVLLLVALKDGNYDDEYDKWKGYLESKIEGYEDVEILTDEDYSLNEKNGKKLAFKNNKPIEGYPYEIAKYYLENDNQTFYELEILTPQLESDGLIEKAEKILNSISWK